MKRTLLFAIVCLILCSCSKKHATIYFDLKSKAIVSCTDTIKKIYLETPQSTVIITGPVCHKPFYIIMKNPDFDISIDGEAQKGYIIPIQPNTSYVVRTEKGDDDGPGALTFSTDENGVIAKASKMQCN